MAVETVEIGAQVEENATRIEAVDVAGDITMDR